MQTDPPELVSTVIPVFNRPRMLVEAVESVLAQTYRPIEIIVVDDGSEDDTPTVAEALQHKHPNEVRFFRKENSGPGPTRELGRLHARGSYIQYLDSDDLLRPRKFELMVRALRENPACGAAYGYICVHPVGTAPLEKPFKGSGETRERLFPWILADRWWNTNCPLYRREVCDAAGPWIDLRWSQDWEHDGRITALGTRLVHVREWVTDERHHSVGRQTDRADWMQPDRLRARLRFFELMLSHAERGGVDEFTPQRQHFTRWVFATARTAAAAGLRDETRRLLDLTERAAGCCREVRKGLKTFRSFCAILGTKTAGKVFLQLQAKRRGPGAFTLQESFAKDLS